MRYLRHAPLAFWVAVTMLLVGISAAAWYAGKDTTVVVTPMANTGETRSDVKAMIERVSGVYPAITTLDLAVWANATAATEVPGWQACAITRALNSSACRRQLRLAGCEIVGSD